MRGLCNVRFDCMGKRVDAGRGGHAGGHRHGGSGIDYSGGRHQEIACHQHLHVPHRIGYRHVAADLASRSGRSRDRHDGNPRFGKLVTPFIIDDRAAVHHQQRGRLGRIQRAAATESDHRVTIACAGRGQRVVHVDRGRFRIDAVDFRNAHALRVAKLDYSRNPLRLPHDGIRDKEGAPRAKLSQRLSQRRERFASHTEKRRNLKRPRSGSHSPATASRTVGIGTSRLSASIPAYSSTGVSE